MNKNQINLTIVLIIVFTALIIVINLAIRNNLNRLSAPPAPKTDNIIAQPQAQEKSVAPEAVKNATGNLPSGEAKEPKAQQDEAENHGDSEGYIGGQPLLQ